MSSTNFNNIVFYIIFKRRGILFIEKCYFKAGDIMPKLKVLLPLAGVVYLIYREYIHGLEYLYNLSLCRGEKAFLFNCNNISTELKALDKISGELEDVRKWSKTAYSKKIYIHGKEDGEIYLRYFKQSTATSRYVIALHGYGCTGRSMLFCAKKFYDGGFNVAVPDLPCHGQSYGRFIGMGQYECRDIIEIAKEITLKDPSAQIMLYGISMGAATVLAATGAKELPQNVRCVVSDCSFTDAKSIFAFQIQNMIHMPTFFVMRDLDRIYHKKTGLSLRDADIIKSVAHSSTPTLFIHGGADRIVPTDMVFKLYNAAACQKDILVVKGAGHGVSAYMDIPLYWGRVFAFADEYMPK